jgi:hypothetical protein
MAKNTSPFRLYCPAQLRRRAESKSYFSDYVETVKWDLFFGCLKLAVKIH